MMLGSPKTHETILSSPVSKETHMANGFTIQDVLLTTILGATTFAVSREWSEVLKNAVRALLYQTYCYRSKDSTSKVECMSATNSVTDLSVAIALTLVLLLLTYYVHYTMTARKKSETAKDQ